MRIKREVFLLFSLLIVVVTFSSWILIQYGEGEIIKPHELIVAQENQKIDRDKPNAKSRDGFSILLGFTENKSNADKIKINFDREFKNKYPCIVEWNEPKFKVFAGNFYTRAEAVALLYKLRETNPKAMIVKTKF